MAGMGSHGWRSPGSLASLGHPVVVGTGALSRAECAYTRVSSAVDVTANGRSLWGENGAPRLHDRSVTSYSYRRTIGFILGSGAPPEFYPGFPHALFIHDQLIDSLARAPSASASTASAVCPPAAAPLPSHASGSRAQRGDVAPRGEVGGRCGKAPYG